MHSIIHVFSCKNADVIRLIFIYNMKNENWGVPLASCVTDV